MGSQGHPCPGLGLSIAMGPQRSSIPLLTYSGSLIIELVVHGVFIVWVIALFPQSQGILQHSFILLRVGERVMPLAPCTEDTPVATTGGFGISLQDQTIVSLCTRDGFLL